MAALIDYPDTLDEFETLAHIMKGGSVTRFGDGCFNVMRGVDDVFQRAEPRLSHLLTVTLLAEPPPGLLLCLPRLRDYPVRGGGFRFWRTLMPGFLPIYHILPKGRTWGSSWITRADAAQWIHTDDFYRRLSRCWADKHVTVVGGQVRNLTKEALEKAPYGPHTIKQILVPNTNAFSEYDRVMKEIGTPQIALLQCGQLARAMAPELVRRGTQVLDLGHLGLFFGPGAPSYGASPAPGVWPYTGWAIREQNESWY